MIDHLANWRQALVRHMFDHAAWWGKKGLQAAVHARSAADEIELLTVERDEAWECLDKCGEIIDKMGRRNDDLYKLVELNVNEVKAVAKERDKALGEASMLRVELDRVRTSSRRTTGTAMNSERESELETLLGKALMWVELHTRMTRQGEDYMFCPEDVEAGSKAEEKRFPSIHLERKIKETLGLPKDYTTLGRGL